MCFLVSPRNLLSARNLPACSIRQPTTPTRFQKRWASPPPSHAALQSGTGSWVLVWYADWAQGTAMWQREARSLMGSLFIVSCSHVFIQLIQLIPDDLSLAPPLYMALFRRGFQGLIRERSQISPDCCEALINERENISLPGNYKMVGVNMCACSVGACVCVCVSVCSWHPALPQKELCCLLFIKQVGWCFHRGSYSLLIGSSEARSNVNGDVYLSPRANVFVCMWREGDCLFFMCAHLTGVKLTPAEEEDLRKRWQHAVGPRFDVIVRLSVMKTSIGYKKKAQHNLIKAVWNVIF